MRKIHLDKNKQKNAKYNNSDRDEILQTKQERPKKEVKE